MKLLRYALLLSLFTVLTSGANAAFDFTLLIQGLTDQYNNPTVYTVPAGYRWTLLNLIQDHHETDGSRAFVSIQLLDGKGSNLGVPVKTAYAAISDLPPSSQPNPPPQPVVIVGPAKVVVFGTTTSPLYATFRYDVNN